jgi:hypothetical protein
MTEIDLTQAEADALISMEKMKVDDSIYQFPQLGESVSIELKSVDKREQFFLDLNRGRIEIKKLTFQNRARKIVVLVRLDLNGSPHRNPDGEEISCPHLHLYREGFGDKWAFAVPADKFPDLDHPRNILEAFMYYCNIVEPPLIQLEVFT